jgi:methylenetetrahydrofolate--tRNA-(uracil-5-)-methyltransferase
MSEVFVSSRYDKGAGTYLNLPLDAEQYGGFVDGLRKADVVEERAFEDRAFFSACMPVEELARMGNETLAHGCMKPVGLVDPRTGRIPHAVVQLRPENKQGTLYGMVGFQTRLKYGEQERLLRTLPGLGGARFARLGSIHRNTFINAPVVLLPTLESRYTEGVIFAGQITGAEGYIAAVGTGLLAGINAARIAGGRRSLVPPAETLLGWLVRHVSSASPRGFQPMNPNFGLLPPIRRKVHNRLRRNLLLSERSVSCLKKWLDTSDPMDGRNGAVEYSGVLS